MQNRGLEILAHGLGGRTDLPLPRWMVIYGGAAVVLVSFAAVRVLWTSSRWENRPIGRPVRMKWPRVGAVLASVAPWLGLAAYLVTLVAATAGSPDPTFNIAPVTVYVLLWVGIALVNALVFDLWAAINPFTSLAGLVDDLAGGPAHPSGQPGWLTGYRPAAWALGGFVWLELVYPRQSEPRVIALAMGGYTLWVLFAARRWGRDWLVRGEGFTAWFSILAAGAPLGRDDRGQWRIRPPFAGLAQLRTAPGMVALVLVLLGSTTFDGFTRTQAWVRLDGAPGTAGSMLLGTTGLLVAIGVVAGLYWAAVAVMARTSRVESVPAPGVKGLAEAFAPSLVPIALAYAVAHYFSLLVLEGQIALTLFSDPFGLGWDLFGTSDRAVNYSLVSTDLVAWIQAGSIVAGHVAGVVVAHDRAHALFPASSAARSQIPLVAAMVAFTVGGLFLLLGG
ncbi:MAG: hypothetical protein ACT4OS_08930 [Acidimicrobiales bacterium]